MSKQTAAQKRASKNYYSQTRNAVWQRVHCRINRALATKKIPKVETTEALLGMNKDEFYGFIQGALQPGMTLEDRHLWHIDHIIPVSTYNLKSPLGRKLAFNYKNVQVLWVEDHRNKTNQERKAS